MSRPAWFLDALREMKETRRGGVVFIVPREGYLTQVSKRMEWLVRDDSRGVRALRRRAVLVLIPMSLAKECLPDVEDGVTLVTLDPDGRVVKTVKADLAETLLPGVFTKEVGRLLCKTAVGSDAPPRELPYGVEWAEGAHKDLFGTAYDPCPPCGLPRIDDKAEEMIKYLRLLGT